MNRNKSNQVLIDDILEFVDRFDLKEEIKDSVFLITGATGLLGSILIRCLLAMKKNIRVLAPVRNMEKAQRMFGVVDNEIQFFPYNIETYDYENIKNVDYIVHCAAPTSSKYFIEHPVETFNTIYKGTLHLLEYARRNPIKGMVYLSSLEVYGEIFDDSEYVTENIQGYINPMSTRSSYPMAKRAMETLSCLYAHEYGIPVKIARLTQTTGAGISADDNRVIVQFARLAAEGKDIVLHTTGEAARPYCYTTDCVSAILCILLNGISGEAYNVANEETYISARNMAEYLKDNFNSNISVRVELNDTMGYAPTTKLRLSSLKLRKLGWTPRYGLDEIFCRIMTYVKNN